MKQIFKFLCTNSFFYDSFAPTLKCRMPAQAPLSSLSQLNVDIFIGTLSLKYSNHNSPPTVKKYIYIIKYVQVS